MADPGGGQTFCYSGSLQQRQQRREQEQRQFLERARQERVFHPQGGAPEGASCQADARFMRLRSSESDADLGGSFSLKASQSSRRRSCDVRVPEGSPFSAGSSPFDAGSDQAVPHGAAAPKEKVVFGADDTQYVFRMKSRSRRPEEAAPELPSSGQQQHQPQPQQQQTKERESYQNVREPEPVSFKAAPLRAPGTKDPSDASQTCPKVVQPARMESEGHVPARLAGDHDPGARSQSLPPKSPGGTPPRSPGSSSPAGPASPLSHSKRRHESPCTAIPALPMADPTHEDDWAKFGPNWRHSQHSGEGKWSSRSWLRDAKKKVEQGDSAGANKPSRSGRSQSSSDIFQALASTAMRLQRMRTGPEKAGGATTNDGNGGTGATAGEEKPGADGGGGGEQEQRISFSDWTENNGTEEKEVKEPQKKVISSPFSAKEYSRGRHSRRSTKAKLASASGAQTMVAS